MTLTVLLQIAQLGVLVGGFVATIAVSRNDTKWVIKSLEDHRDEDNRRFDELKDELKDLR